MDIIIAISIKSQRAPGWFAVCRVGDPEGDAHIGEIDLHQAIASPRK